MSKTLVDLENGISLTRFCGPMSLGQDRICFQINGRDSVWPGSTTIACVWVTRAEAEAMARAILQEKEVSE